MEPNLSNEIDSVPERFVPAEAEGQLTAAEHFARYWWACQLADGRRILDAGCGIGYGTNLLAAAGAAEAVGVDIAPAIVDAARGAAAPGARFEVADVHALPFDDGAFDLVTCFEVIEHVEERDAVIAELDRTLDRSGVLLISSPNRDVHVPGNPHHVHEYVPEELREALQRRFRHVALRRQHDWIASAVLDDDALGARELEPIDGVAVAKAVRVEPGSEPYTLALASQSPLPDLPPRIVLTGLAEVRKWRELWQEQQEVLQRQHEILRAQHDQRAELRRVHEELRRSERKLARIPKLELEREEAGAEARAVAKLVEEEATARIRQLESDVADLLAETDRLRRELHTVYTSKSWRLTRPLRRARSGAG